MEAKSAQFNNHVAQISLILKNECRTSNVGALVTTQDFYITIPNGPTPPFRKVTTDFGRIESALELPISNKRHQRKYWVGLHESWQKVSKHKIRFMDCSLRLYVGNANQEPVHFLRLEWVAPEANSGAYQGEHAGHPHWHIDRPVLAGSKSLSRSLVESGQDEIPALEEFSELTFSSETILDPIDCSWIQEVHIPAQAGWMKKWNGTDVPGPHQSEPDDFGALENWWAGALRYFVHELSALRI
jgi:hypothetical protein